MATTESGTRISVSVCRAGKAETEIKNEPRIVMFGKSFIRYQGQLYEVDAQDRIHLDTKPSARATAPGKGAQRGGDSNWSSTPRKDKPDTWHPKQLEVIESPLAHRLVVTAPPGSGKTATACCRVARLIEELGGDAHKISVISFTRAAVDEFRGRIGLYLTNPELAHGIRITTLDSFAWLLQSGFDENAQLTGSFEDNIEAALKLLNEKEGLKEEIRSSIRHLVVDEAQDFLGVRAKLVLGIIAALDGDAGLTVLGDEAQSIYGFSLEDGEDQEAGDHLIKLIRDRVEPRPDEIELIHIFRAETASLATLITAARKIVLKDEPTTPKAVAELMEMIRAHAQGETNGLSADVPDSCVILLRNRVDVLSAVFSEQAPPARVRLSGHSLIINPVLAVCLFDYGAPRLSRAEFEKRWTERLPHSGDPARIWDALVRLAGDGRGAVEMRRLRFALRRKGLPPSLAWPDTGDKGPLLSTIHAFKGREAAEVHLMLPRAPQTDSGKLAEEARVLYVGASRAIRKLKVGEAKAHYGSGREKGRAYRGFKTHGSARVEIGRDGDVDPEGMVGTAVCPTEEEGHRIHSRLAMLRPDQSVDVTADFLSSRQKRYLLHASPEGQPLGALSKSVSWDLWKIIERVVGRNRKPSPRMMGSKVFGARTLVVLPDEPVLETLHEPWRESGFVLAPVVLGFPFCNSNFWKKKYGR